MPGAATSSLTFNDAVLDDAVARITVDPGKDKELLEAQVACTMSIDEQIGRIVLAHEEGREEGLEEGMEKGLKQGRKESEATIAKLQEDSAAERAAYEARIKELEALLAQKG